MTILNKEITNIEQISYGSVQANNWENLGEVNKKSIVSLYSLQDRHLITPRSLHLFNFDANIPTGSIVNQIILEFSVSGDVDLNGVKLPTVWLNYSNNVNEHDFETDSYNKLTTPYVVGHGNYSPHSRTVRYTFTELVVGVDLFKKMNRFINEDFFGFIIQFPSVDLNYMKDGMYNVALKDFRVIISYTESNIHTSFNHDLVDKLDTKQFIDFAKELSQEYRNIYAKTQELYTATCFSTFYLTFNVMPFKTYGSLQREYDFNIPPGLQLVHYYPSNQHIRYDDENNKIIYNYDDEELRANKDASIKFEFKCLTTGIKEIGTVSDTNEHLNFILLVTHNGSLSPFGSVDEIIVTNNDAYKFNYTDFNVRIKCLRINELVETFSVADLDNIKRVDFDAKNSSDGVICESSDDNSVTVRLPYNKEVIVMFKVQCIPRVEGQHALRIVSELSGAEYIHTYFVLPKIHYRVEFTYPVYKESKCIIHPKCKSGYYIYPVTCSEKPYILRKPTLKAYLLTDKQYIGPVELKLSHLEATLDYNDTLLKTISKNNRYLGKKNAIDESLPLVLLVPLEDAYTIKALADLDKPVPINTNIRAKNSDVLNHKGWGVVHGVSVERANMNWYKVTCKVAYLTKNLHARFKVNIGSRITDYFLPNNMLRIVKYGSELADNFFINTTGGYSYMPSDDTSAPSDDPAKNRIHSANTFNLNEGQYFSFRTKEYLNIKSRVCFTWFTIYNPRDSQHNISRVIQILDSENEPLFEYEYYDIILDSPDLMYNARVLCRVKYKNGWKVILNKPIRLNFDVSYDPNDDDNMQMYGSELIFEIINDKLSIFDKGISGKEISVENIDIENSIYGYQVRFENNNTINESSVLNYVDMEIEGLKNNFDDNNYENLIVTPFPIPSKKILFTREGEDGTLYYVKDDATESTFMQSPFFLYQNGVNLKNSEDVSIFDLDSSIITLFITNGLIKLGLNRYNGLLTIYRYDGYNTYIHTNTLQFTKFEDVNINYYNEDKIVLQVSDSILTVWKGRPYFELKHESESIIIKDEILRVFSDGVGDKTSPVITMFNLINQINELPANLGSIYQIEESAFHETDKTGPHVDKNSPIINVDNQGTAKGSEITVQLASTQEPYKAYFIINNEILTPVITDNTCTLTYLFPKAGEYTIYYFETHLSNQEGQCFIPSKIVNVEDNSYKITPTFDREMYYMEQDFTGVLTYAGNPAPDKQVSVTVNSVTYFKTTDANGKFKLNNRLPFREKEFEDGNYEVIMQYAEESVIKARAIKRTMINKGGIDIKVESNETHDYNVRRGGYITAQFTNNLDLNDDDIEPGEQYLKNTSVVLTINGIDYPRITEDNGTTKLNINLPGGSYDLTVKFFGDNRYNGSTLQVELHVIE